MPYGRQKPTGSIDCLRLPENSPLAGFTDKVQAHAPGGEKGEEEGESKLRETCVHTIQQEKPAN